jgi:prepilin-type N-terminal cleavage/methylation domain-containing protein/prepilin-type processing-associated H-X9-DG protein
MKRTREAFTLIELLVVIAIITILAAILFPVFGRVREAARRSSCTSNAKQVGLAVIQYKNDYGNVFPLDSYTVTQAADDIAPANTFTWIDAIMPYAKSENIFRCPSAPKAGTKVAGLDNSLYTFSAYLTWQNGKNKYGWQNYNNGISLPEVLKPAETIFYTPDALDADAAPGQYGMGNRVDQRHLGTANFLFYDGHVKAMQVTQTSDCPVTSTGIKCSPGSGYTFSYWDNQANS